MDHIGNCNFYIENENPPAIISWVKKIPNVHILFPLPFNAGGRQESQERAIVFLVNTVPRRICFPSLTEPGAEAQTLAGEAKQDKGWDKEQAFIAVQLTFPSDSS